MAAFDALLRRSKRMRRPRDVFGAKDTVSRRGTVTITESFTVPTSCN